MEIIKDNLIGGDLVRPVTVEITLTPGTYPRGAALGLVEGKHGLIGETGFTADTFNAILCEEQTITEDKKVMAYINGQFVLSEMTAKVGFDKSTLEVPGRKLQLIIK